MTSRKGLILVPLLYVVAGLRQTEEMGFGFQNSSWGPRSIILPVAANLWDDCEGHFSDPALM